MIRAQDIAVQGPELVFAAGQPSARDASLAQRLLHVALFITILSSCFVFIQPAPYEYLVALLAVACVAAHVAIDRKITPLLLLLLIWNFSGCFALMPVLDKPDPPMFLAISFYLAFTAVVFACLFAQDSVRRLATMRAAYILSGLIATATGVIGYFDLTHHAQDLFTFASRASATFKDPNVFGPFLILPILLLIERNIAERVKLRDIVCILTLLFGLLLSFSRGAWGSFTFSAALMLWLLFITSSEGRFRFRILAFTLGILVTVLVIFVVVIHIDALSTMLVKRASLLQDYDVGPGGRFTIQKLSAQQLLLYPNGMGPFEFARQFGLASHNTYLGTMLQYGWIGGLCYLTLTLSTLALGFRTAFIRTPWQTYLIVVYATYVGQVFESAIIDTDHWRHYYLLLGIVWGLAAATSNHVRSRRMPAPIGYPTASFGALQ